MKRQIVDIGCAEVADEGARTGSRVDCEQLVSGAGIQKARAVVELESDGLEGNGGGHKTHSCACEDVHLKDHA